MGKLLLEDGTSALLLEDGCSFLLTEEAESVTAPTWSVVDGGARAGATDGNVLVQMVD